jgi:hypothetical protein
LFDVLTSVFFWVFFFGASVFSFCFLPFLVCVFFSSPSLWEYKRCREKVLGLGVEMELKILRRFFPNLLAVSFAGVS